MSIGRGQPELQNEHPDLLLKILKRLQECRIEEVSIQEFTFDLPALSPNRGKFVNFLTVIRNLERENKIFRDLRHQLLDVTLVWISVISGINTELFEDLGIFGQAIPLKPGLGKCPTGDVKLSKVANCVLKR